MCMEGIGSLPWGRRKRNSCPLLDSLLLSSLLLFFWVFLCSVVSFPAPPQKSLCNIPQALAFFIAFSLTLCLNSPNSTHPMHFSVPERWPNTQSCAHIWVSSYLHCWRWLWGTVLQGLQSRHHLYSSSSPPLCTRFDIIYKVTSRRTYQGQRSCHRNQEKENRKVIMMLE